MSEWENAQAKHACTYLNIKWKSVSQSRYVCGVCTHRTGLASKEYKLSNQRLPFHSTNSWLNMWLIVYYVIFGRVINLF